MKRFLLWAVATVSTLVLLVVALGFAFIHTFYPLPPKPGFAKATTLAEAQRQDLEYFRNYISLNRAYTSAERGQAETMLAGYEAEAGKMTPAQFELAISRMVALSDNGHSEDHPYLFHTRHDNLPCLLYHFSDGYYIVRARPACEALLGAKLVAIDGHAIDEIVGRMFDYVRGPRNHYDQYSAPFFLESPALLNAAGLADAPDSVTLRVQMPGGGLRDVMLKADPPDVQRPWWAWSDFDASPLVLPGEGRDWKTLLPADAGVSTLLEQYNLPFRSEYRADEGIYYLAIRFNTDFFGQPIGKFVDRVEKEIAAAKPRVIIVDLRLDKGGDLTKTASLMAQMTKSSPGIRHVYVLTSAWTFSAGITSVALAKARGGNEVTILGEPVGDRLRFWAEGRDMTLPNSHIQVHYATGMHDYSEPCWGERGCFWIMRLYPMNVPTLTPDVTIPYTFSDYMASRDPVMDYALRLSRP